MVNQTRFVLFEHWDQLATS